MSDVEGIWIGVNVKSEVIWLLEHEGDYNKGDILIHITIEAGATVVRTLPPAHE